MTSSRRPVEKCTYYNPEECDENANNFTNNPRKKKVFERQIPIQRMSTEVFWCSGHRGKPV